MDIAAGFAIEAPAVFVPWGIGEAALQRLLGDRLRRVSAGYWSASCRTLGGMAHELGFHFRPRGAGGRLVELEFFRRAYPDPAASYAEFQRHFEAAFGRPTRSVPGAAGYPELVWELGRVRILHRVIDRFGPEEHMRIQYAG